MDLAVLPDGRVRHGTRTGELWLHDPQTGREYTDSGGLTGRDQVVLRQTG